MNEFNIKLHVRMHVYMYLDKHLYNAGPTSKTLGRTNITHPAMIPVHWEDVVYRRNILENDWTNGALYQLYKQAELGQDNFLRMVRWTRWHRPPDTGLEKAAHATSLSRWLPTILNSYEWAGRKHFLIENLNARAGDEPSSEIRRNRQAIPNKRKIFV